MPFARTQAFAQLFKDRTSSATALIVALLDEYGTECLEWEPETLWLQMKDDFPVDVPQLNKDKIQAAVMVLTTNQFWRSLDPFIHVCNALAGSLADFANFDPATVEEMCWAITEVSLLDPPEEGETFAPEIVAYMKARLVEEGFTTVPKLLAPFVGDEPSESSVTDVLSLDGIDAKAYYNSQGMMRQSLDEEIVTRLGVLLQQVMNLPLQEADPKALEQLRQRANKALAIRRSDLQQVQESVPQSPTL